MSIYTDYFRRKPLIDQDAANDQSYKKQLTREQIAQDIKNFLAAGGRITVAGYTEPTRKPTLTQQQIAYHKTKNGKTPTISRRAKQ